MVQDYKKRERSCEQACESLVKLICVDQETARQVKEQIKESGIQYFFDNLDSSTFPVDVLGKLESVRLVLIGMGELQLVEEREE